MDAHRWERIQELFHAAADLSRAEREAWLRTACGDDQDLLAEVLALLAEDDRDGTILDEELAVVAERTLEPGIPPALLDQRFGPWRIVRVLGEGGMGVVYLARRDDLGSLAAIKILRDAWLSPARRERFAAEQRTLARLNHPSIAQLYDANTLPDGTPWFVMEYVDGSTLTDYCAHHAASVAERLRLFRAVCDAVQHAHQHLVIHRDLKPSNVVVKADGSLKLLDFGIAKQLDALDDPADQTRTDIRFMTPAYAAPEQIRGEPVGVHTDIYSLGVILYELLVGRLPFDFSHRTLADVERTITEREPERPSAAALRMRRLQGEARGAVSAGRSAWADLDVLCLTAMHKDPARRYRSVEALIRDLDHFMAGEPLEARPDTWSYRLGKFSRRNWRALAAAGIVLTMVVGLVAFYTYRLASARNAAVTEAARTTRIQEFMLSLFSGGEADVGPADTLRVITLVDRGLREAKALEGDTSTQAQLYETLGGVYQQLGKLGRADTLLQAALAERRAFYRGDSHETAQSLVALGLLRQAQAEYEESERLIRQGLAMQQRISPLDGAAVARAETALGEVLQARGDYDAAIPLLEGSVRLLSADSGTDLSTALTDLANTHFYAGHYGVADSLNRLVLAMDRRLYGPRHPNVGEDLVNLGAIDAEAGRSVQAEEFYRQAVDILSAWYGSDNPETASVLTMLGRVMVGQKRYDEADEILQRALAIQERVYGPVHPRVASALNELGKVAEQRGDLDGAAADFRRMADIYRRVYGGHHYLLGIALSNLAGVEQRRKQYARAEQLFRQVIRLYTEVLSPEHQLMGIARVRLGSVLRDEHRDADALTESRAGYRILTAQASPPRDWVETARREIADDYEALGQRDEAARFRTAAADSAAHR